MTEKNETAGPPRPAGAETSAPARAAPGPEDRLRLVLALQARAAARADPLAANLEVISGDLIQVAYRQKEILEANLAATRDPVRRQEQFAQDTERYLKLVRQLDRLTQCARQLGAASPPGAGPP